MTPSKFKMQTVIPHAFFFLNAVHIPPLYHTLIYFFRTKIYEWKIETLFYFSSFLL